MRAPPKRSPPLDILNDALPLSNLDILSPALATRFNSTNQFLLFAGFSGSPLEIGYQAERIRDLIGARGEILDDDAARKSYELLRDIDFHSAPLAAQIAVPPARLARALEACGAELNFALTPAPASRRLFSPASSPPKPRSRPSRDGAKLRTRRAVIFDCSPPRPPFARRWNSSTLRTTARSRSCADSRRPSIQPGSSTPDASSEESDGRAERHINESGSRRLRLRPAVRLRSLRTLRRGLPDLRRDAMRDGLAARPNLSDEVARRRTHRARRRRGAPSRFVPRMPRMRDRVPVRRSLRPLDRRRARIRRAQSSSRLRRAN